MASPPGEHCSFQGFQWLVDAPKCKAIKITIYIFILYFIIKLIITLAVAVAVIASNGTFGACTRSLFNLLYSGLKAD